MTRSTARSFTRFAVLVGLIAASAFAQSQSITGVVNDPSGGPVPAVSVALMPESGGRPVQTTSTDVNGTFAFTRVRTGHFYIDISLKGFQPEHIPVIVAARPPEPLTVSLKLSNIREEITVRESADSVNTESSGNLDTVTLDRDSLNNLPIFDQDYVATMSRFLDPGAVGTGGATLVVDGMEQTGVGVSASAIQQVRINQNPYSSEFSRPGRAESRSSQSPEPRRSTEPSTSSFGTMN